MGRLEAFAERLGHAFSDMSLLEEALTHPSFQVAGRRDNQRMEFLGDRVLGLAIAEALLAAHPEASEGEVAPRLNALVRKETCADIAIKLSLGEALTLGRSEMISGGRRKTAALGDAMEAVVAAVYLDAGYAAARDIVLRQWGPLIATLDEVPLDSKSALQEFAQARGQSPPRYDERGRAGPAHAPMFTIEVRLESGETAVAEAGSKRAAQQAAAAALLKNLGASDD